jgi:D-3-phosphoglycerate dehydrogenase intervening domain
MQWAIMTLNPSVCLLPQGILEQVTTATVNLVNADLLAKNRGLTITETTRPSSGKWVPL